MNGENSPQPELNPADVAACAYMIWEKEGKPHGRDDEHWFQAETLLRAMLAAEAEAAAKETAKAAAPAGKPAPATRKRRAKRTAEQQGECATE